MSSFEDLKLDADLLARLEALGYRRPTALQREAVPVIARGTTAVGIASPGSGKTLAYTLGLTARVQSGAPALQALVLRPTDDAAAATAHSMHSVIGGLGLRVQICRPDTRLTAHVAVSSPATALASVQHSAIKLNGLTTLVVDGAAAMFDLGAGEPLETLSSQVPKEAQRILLTSRFSRETEDWAERHARRARKLVYLPAELEPLREASVEYLAGAREGWIEPLVALLGAGASRKGRAGRILCRLQAEADALAERLAVRGIAATLDADAEGVLIEVGEPSGGEYPLSVFWGAPADMEVFLPAVRNTPHVVAFVEPNELDHLRRLAATVEAELRALKPRTPPETHRSVQATREALLEALRERDLEPYVLLIEPLLAEHTPVEVAAAATALLRTGQPAAAAPTLPAWTRLYFAVGRRDSVRPADIVGAIAGESPASGEQIGRIEIRDTHSLVEVDAQVADRVIKSLARTTIRGRPANVRVFRE